MRDFIYAIPEMVFSDNDLTLNDIRIYMIFRSFMDATKDNSYPTKDNFVKKKFNMDNKAISDSINRLIEKGYMRPLDEYEDFN